MKVFWLANDKTAIDVICHLKQVSNIL